MKIPFDSDVLVLGASPPTDVTAVQDGPTSIRVTWTPPSPLGDTTGYRISFTGGGSSDSVDVSGGNSISHTLTTGLTNGETYTISVTTISSTGLPSAPVPDTVGLGRSTHFYCLYKPTTDCSLPTPTVVYCSFVPILTPTVVCSVFTLMTLFHSSISSSAQYTYNSHSHYHHHHW